MICGAQGLSGHVLRHCSLRRVAARTFSPLAMQPQTSICASQGFHEGGWPYCPLRRSSQPRLSTAWLHSRIAPKRMPMPAKVVMVKLSRYQAHSLVHVFEIL